MWLQLLCQISSFILTFPCWLLQAVVYYTENLKTPDIQIQQGSCLALKCLRVSITQHLSVKLFTILFGTSQHVPMCLQGNRECEPYSWYVGISGWRSSLHCQRDCFVLWYKHTFFFFSLTFICFFVLPNFLPINIADKKSFLPWQEMEQSYNEAEVKTYENKETDITIL